MTRTARIVDTDVDGDGEPDVRVCKVTGELFFATSNDLVYQFDYAADPARVVIDLTDSHIWDASTVAAPDGVQAKYERLGKSVEIVGLNRASAERRMSS
ncbi:STAS domain-containing protein [Janibacter limosus]|uniref:STAS domain-containing protein n=1 Tax=Janibacter limosus TaxID=53458 RepID=UPI0035E2AD68